MKEGYFQKKLTELAEQQQALYSSLKLLNAEIDRLESRVGGLKPLIKRLKDIESFKEQTFLNLDKKNAERIEQVQKEFAESLKKQVRDVTRKKADTLDQSLQEINDAKQLFKEYATSISRIEAEINFVKEFHRLLVMKLVNKGVLSVKEQEEIKRRSVKKLKE